MLGLITLQTRTNMGVLKWMARIGAVGGTARWAAKGYNFYRQRHADRNEFPDSTIYRLMIVHRYKTFPNRQHEQWLLSQADQYSGLYGLVVEILMAEAGYAETDASAQQMFSEIIVEELQKAGISQNIIFGRSSSPPEEA